MRVLKIHEVASLFPVLQAKEMKDLREDIVARGIQVPILVNKKKDTIIDGRNRWMIAHQLKLPDSKIPMEVFKGKDEEIPGEIIARNILRRHLSDDQRVALVAKIRGLQFAADGKERMSEGGKGLLNSPNLPAHTHVRLADEAQTTEHKARQALDVVKHAQDIINDVVSGKVPLRAAAKVARARKPSTRKARPKKVRTLEQQVQAKFSRFMEYFPHHQRREVRSILRKLL